MQTIWTLTAASLLFAISACQTVPKHSERLEGSWSTVLWEDYLPDGAVQRPFGENPKGILFYDSKGNVAVQIMKNPRPSGETELLDGYFAYFGKYSVDWKNHIVVHTIEGALQDFPIGQSFRIPFSLANDELTFSPHWKTEDGKEVSGKRVSKRITK